MHILILNWRDTKNPLAGGAEIVTMEHAKAWVQAGYTVTWLTSSFPGGAKTDRTLGVEIVRQGNAKTIYFFAPFFYLFSGRHFDIVIDEIHGLPFFTPLYVRKPKVAFIHEVANEIWDYMRPFPFNILGRFVERLSFQLYRNVMFWTDASSTIQELEAYGIPREHCRAIPCPVTNSILAKPTKKEKNPTYIFVSRVVRMKGIEDVIRAFVFIHKTQLTSQLWIIGFGNEKYVKKLRNLAFSYGIGSSVTFFGRVSETKKREYMRRAHILLHASVKEGWGLVVLEAASQGTPTGAYNVPGLVDTVQNGKTGIIVSDNTPHALAAASIQLYHDVKRYRAFQHNALAWVRSLTWKNASAESLRLLQSVV